MMALEEEGVSRFELGCEEAEFWHRQGKQALEAEAMPRRALGSVALLRPRNVLAILDTAHCETETTGQIQLLSPSRLAGQNLSSTVTVMGHHELCMEHTQLNSPN